MILLIPGVADARPESSRMTDSLLRVLDHEIEMKPVYDARKYHVIDSLKREAGKQTGAAELFESYRKLYAEYRSFSMDTLVLVARKCRHVALSMGSDSLVWLSRLMEAEAYKGIGRYTESLDILDSLPEEARRMYREKILNRYSSVYYSLFENTYPRSDADIFRTKMVSYRDSLIAMYPEGSWNRSINLAESLRMASRPDEALSVIDNMLRTFGDEIRDNIGILYYIKAECLIMSGRFDEAKAYLALSAVHDIRKSVKKYTALQELAKLLNNQGDIARAYRYILCSIEDIQQGNARSRIFGITESLPIITSAYNIAAARSDRSRKMFVSIILTLLFLLAIALMFVWKKNKSLNVERQALSERTAELTEANGRVGRLNRQLEESAKLKERHIGNLFNLCSEYIDGMERNRVLLERKIKAGRVPEFEPHAKFLEQFDQIFLDIFPDFVDRFNGLLKPEFRFEVAKGSPLPPEIRIYAMVRLGINNNVKIASFLHYSVQTVYNYRFRTRNMSDIPRNEFPDRVRNL